MSKKKTEGKGQIIWKVDEEDNLRAYHSENPDDPVAWAPQPGSQEAFLTCPVREALFCGSRGPGKTDALLMDYAQHVGQGYKEDWRGIIFRRTLPELKDIIAKSKKWYGTIFPDAIYNKVSKTWTFRDGEELIFGFLDKPEDYNKYHGHQYPFMGFEELTNWADPNPLLKLFSTNRSSNKAVPLKIRATCNPSGPGHNWVRARYNLPCPPGQIHSGVIRTSRKNPDTGEMEKEHDRIAIHGMIHENKILLHAQPDYIETLRASCSSKAQEAAWIYGSWDITSGGMFDDVWESDIHVITGLTPEMIPSGWRMDRSYDHGQSRPFSVGWWAQSNGEPLTLPSGRVVGQVRGDLFRVREWYGWNGTPNVGIRLTAAEIALGIRERQREWGIDRRVYPGVADGSIFDQWEPGKSIAGDMRKYGVRWNAADKSKGSRSHGWNAIRTRLKNAKPTQTEDGNYVREKPGLFIADACTQFLRTVPVLSRDKKNPDDVDTDTEDHIADEVRYRCRAKKARRSTMMSG